MTKDSQSPTFDQDSKNFDIDGEIHTDVFNPKLNISLSDSLVKSLSDISDQDFADFIDNQINELSSKGFGPVSGGIHDPRAIMFYDKVLQANDSVLDLLHNGYKPDIVTKLPEATDLRNNLSALQNIQFVYTKTDKWIKERIVAKVSHKPYFVNPITVAQKLDGEGNLKLRQCIDLSRTLNDCLRKVKMKMEDIGAVLPRVTPGCWMSVLDISSMYCHLRIHPQFRSLFGFAVVNPSGVREFYECLTLPFGTGRNSLHFLHFYILFDEGMLKEHNKMLQNLLTHISFCGLRTLNFGESKRIMFIVFLWFYAVHFSKKTLVGSLFFRHNNF